MSLSLTGKNQASAFCVGNHAETAPTAAKLPIVFRKSRLSLSIFSDEFCIIVVTMN